MRRYLWALGMLVPWVSSCLGPCPDYGGEVLVPVRSGDFQGVRSTGGGAEIPIDRYSTVFLSLDREAGTGTIRYVDLDGIEQEVDLEIAKLEVPR